MSRKVGPTLDRCRHCGARHQKIVWKDKVGWVCQSCETVISPAGVGVEPCSG